MNILGCEEIEVDGIIYPCNIRIFEKYELTTVYSRPKGGIGIGGLVWFVIVTSKETNNKIIHYGNFTYKTRENLFAMMELLDELR